MQQPLQQQYPQQQPQQQFQPQPQYQQPQGGVQGQQVGMQMPVGQQVAQQGMMPQQQQGGVPQQQMQGGMVPQQQQQQMQQPMQQQQMQQQQMQQQQQQQQMQMQQQQQQPAPAQPDPVPQHDVATQDGARFNFNRYPNTKEEGIKMVLPLGLMYTPLARTDLEPLAYDPIMCKTCKAIVNPFCNVDEASRLWVCPFCIARNNLPANYSPANKPTELCPGSTTVEYALKSRPVAPPMLFVYVVDTCLPKDELEGLRDCLSQSLSLLPETAKVALVTFGANINVWELGCGDLQKSFVFSGHRPYPSTQLGQYLIDANNFICSMEDCELTITGILDELTADPWPVKQDERPHRCTGAALEVALGLLELSAHQSRGRVMMFVGGPCTKGPGNVVSLSLEETLRGHTDIRTDQAKYFAKAQEYYEGLAERFTKRNDTCDIFAGCLDQVGLSEMQACCESTGGALMMVDRFCGHVFKRSLPQFFARDAKGDLSMGTGVVLEAQTSPNTKLAGLIGPLCSLGKDSPSVLQNPATEWGQGKTCAWQAGSITPRTSVSLFLEPCGQPSQPGEGQQAGAGQDSPRYIQIICSYAHASGEARLRVTTLRHIASPTADPGLHTQPGVFDQDVAAVLTARVAVDMMTKSNNSINGPMKYIDRTLIRYCQQFGSYTPDQPQSLRLTPDFTLFPQFMFHLRRSDFLQVFNSSPDETAFFRSILLREGTDNGILMIQPTLHEYSFKGPPTAVLLDSKSVNADTILVLDTFFDVLIHNGSTIASWIDQKYHEQPQHDSFRQLLKAPSDHAASLRADRFPAPRFTECKQNDSQSRILMNRINPSATYHTDPGSAYNSRVNQNAGANGEVVFTDDANMDTFMAYLKKVATGSDK